MASGLQKLEIVPENAQGRELNESYTFDHQTSQDPVQDLKHNAGYLWKNMRSYCHLVGHFSCSLGSIRSSYGASKDSPAFALISPTQQRQWPGDSLQKAAQTLLTVISSTLGESGITTKGEKLLPSDKPQY